MPDGKRHCAIVLTTDFEGSGFFRRLIRSAHSANTRKLVFRTQPLIK